MNNAVHQSIQLILQGITFFAASLRDFGSTIKVPWPDAGPLAVVL
jgi:hypothetical protein